MKMEVITVPQRFQSQYSALGSKKVKDWTGTLTSPAVSTAAIATNPEVVTQSQLSRQMKVMSGAASLPPYMQCDTINKIKNSITKKSTSGTHAITSMVTGADSAGKRIFGAPTALTKSASTKGASKKRSVTAANDANNDNHTGENRNFLFYCDNIETTAGAVGELSLRLLDELRAAKSRHLACTEVSLPCDLTPRIAAEILRLSGREPCGVRGCTVHIEFEDEPDNSRRIATLKLDPDTVSTFEVYLTLRQDHRGWTSLLPQFMKNLTRTITISPDFTIIKHKLYSSPQLNGSGVGDIFYGHNSENLNRGTRIAKKPSAAISTPLL